MGLWKEEECIDFKSTRSVDLIDASSLHQPWFTMALPFKKLAFIGWKPDQVKELEKLLVKEISPILMTSLTPTFLANWLQYLDARAPATRLLLYSKTTGNFDSWSTGGFTGSFPFEASMQTTWNAWKNSKFEKPWLAGLSADDMGGIKLKVSSPFVYSRSDS